MKSFLLLLLLSIFSVQLFSQKFDKIFLENKNKQLRKEISELNKALAKNKKESQSTFIYVTNLQKKIRVREKLISNSIKEKKLLEDDIYLKQLEINKLNRELNDLRKDYEEVLVKSYKSKSVQNKILFVLSAKDFSQSLRRLKYLKLYADYQNNKSKDIQLKVNEIGIAKKQKEKSVQDKTFLLAQQKVELEKLSTEKKEKTIVVNNYKLQQGDFLAQIRAKQLQSKKNQRLITKIINEEIAAAKKAAEEEKRLLAAKIKADKEIADAKAKADREAEIQREKLRKAEELAKNASAAEKIKADKLATLERNKLKIADDKAKAIPTIQSSSTVISSEVLSDNFKNSRGRLPFPVDGGSIIIPFGSSKHPLDQSVTIDNPGVDIVGSRNSKAKAVFEGTVVRVVEIDGTKNIILSHGDYYSVYNNLDDIYVKKGDKVKRSQYLGHIYTDSKGDTIMKFMITKGNIRQNPAIWLK